MRPTWNEAKHTVPIRMPSDTDEYFRFSEEITTWKRDNLLESDYIYHIARDRHETLTLLVGFVNKSLAMLFKLRWAQ